MIRSLIGIALGLMIGAACRWFDVPVPSPPKLIGAILVVAMTVGYIATDRVITAKSAAELGTPQLQSDISKPGGVSGKIP